MMKKSEIVFSTATWARTKKEKYVIEKTLSALGKYGFPVVVVDKKKSKFPIEKKKLKKSGCRVYKISGSFFQQRKLSFTEAAKLGKNVFWLESDKLDFVEYNMNDILGVFKRRQHRDFIIVPCHNRKSFLKYPKFQQIIENSINSILSEILGLKGVFTYGPFIVPSRFVPILKNINGNEFGWGVPIFFLFFAFVKKIQINMIPLNVNHPPDVQTKETLKILRLEQLKSCILAIEKSIKLFKIKT